MFPRVLRVETGFSPLKNARNVWWADILDYQVYENTPRWWRRLEEILRLDIKLALHARKAANQYDIIWADSEKVGIPLAFLRVRKPTVTVAHYLASKKKRFLLRMTGLTKKWAGIGYLSEADRDFLRTYYGIPSTRLFRAATMDLSLFAQAPMTTDGPIISLGVAERDYNTMIAALSTLPGYETEIYASSRYGDKFNDNVQMTIPDSVHFKSPVYGEDLVNRYKQARFAVVPLEDTTHFTAGYSVALEASACGKAVIATSTPGMSSFVIDGETGILVPPYDVEAMRAAIQKLWTRPEYAHQLGQNGRRYIEDEYDPVKVNTGIKEFLIQLHDDG